MATIITRETGATAKGSPLTNAEVDNNFINLNTEVTPSRPLAKPSLLLDFANSETLDSRVAFSRSSHATYFNKLGTIGKVSADKPRIDYDPSTRECKGLLIEDQRTNLVNFNTLGFNGYYLLGFPDAGIAPDGSYTAALMVPTTNSSNHRHEIAHAVTAATTYTHSIFAKASGYGELRFFTFADNNGYVGTNQTVTFNIINGTITGAGSAVVPSITPIGDGWYRCTATVSSNQATSTAYIGWQVQPVGNSGSSFAGDGVSGMFLWGYQREVGNFASSYIYPTVSFTSRNSSATYFNKNGVLKTAGINQARTSYKYDLSTKKWISQGLLLESAASNYFSYSLFNDATAQNISITRNVGIAPDGSNTAVLMTVTNTNNPGYFSSIPGGVSAGQAFTFSVWVKAGTTSEFVLEQYQNAYGSPTFVTAGIASGPGTVNTAGSSASFRDLSTTEWTRIYVVSTMVVSGQSNPSLKPQSIVKGTAVGDSIYFWGAQYELGSAPTSLIPTYGASASRAADISSIATSTRSADSGTISGKTFDSFFDYKESSVLVEQMRQGATNTDSTLFVVSGGTGNFQIYQYRNSARTDLYAAINNHTNLQAGISSSNSTISTGYTKYAGGFKTNDFAFYVNGTLIGSDSSGVVPNDVSTFSIGSLPGHYKKISYYPKKLLNSELQALTK